MSFNGQTQPSFSTSEPTAREGLQQEDMWPLAKDERHSPTTLFGSFVNPMVLKVGPQTRHTNI